LKPQAVPLDRFAIGAATDDRRGDDPITVCRLAAGDDGNMQQTMRLEREDTHGGQMPMTLSLAVSRGTNQLTGDGYFHDVLGNLVTMPAADGVGTVSMTYLDQGHIGTLTDAAGAVWKYYYDSDGKRRIKVKTAGGAATEPDGQGGVRLVADRSYYFYEGEDLICQQDVGALVQDDSQYEPKFLLLDHLGSTRAELVFDPVSLAPQIQEYYDLMPYGEVIDPPTTQESVLFTGKPRDLESALDYLGARYYISNSFRWTSPDDIFADTDLTRPISWNKFNYSRNNPVRYVDKNGREVRAYTEELQPSSYLPVKSKIIDNIIKVVLPAARFPRHTFLHIKTDKSNITIELGGPREGSKKGTPILTELAKDGIPGKRPMQEEHNVYRPQDVEADDYSFENKIIHTYDQIKNNLPDYDPLGPNCNGFIRFLIEAAGGGLRLPDEARGGDKTLEYWKLYKKQLEEEKKKEPESTDDSPQDNKTK